MVPFMSFSLGNKGLLSVPLGTPPTDTHPTVIHIEEGYPTLPSEHFSPYRIYIWLLPFTLALIKNGISSCLKISLKKDFGERILATFQHEVLTCHYGNTTKAKPLTGQSILHIRRYPAPHANHEADTEITYQLPDFKFNQNEHRNPVSFCV